jgi:hypothetical protein
MNGALDVAPRIWRPIRLGEMKDYHDKMPILHRQYREEQMVGKSSSAGYGPNDRSPGDHDGSQIK